ncbi:MAG: hypothetical protein ABI725_05285 [Chloroflexota bacterium]
MIEVATAEGAAARNSRAAVESRPYAPSWLDLVVRAIDAAPGPTWIAYVVIGIAFLLMVNIEGWLTGIPLGSLDPAQSIYALFFLLPLLVYHYQARIAGEAVDSFRPATDLDDNAAAALRYRLTVTPARSALVTSAAAVLINIGWLMVDPAGFQLADKSELYVALRVGSESLLSAAIFVLIFQVLRQMRTIAGLHRAATHVDLIRPAPMHAFARLTSRNALGVIAFAILSGLPLPGIPEATWFTTVVLWTVPMIILGAAVFVLPLRGMNRRLVAERSHWLDNIGLRIHAASDALHRVVDDEAANATDVDASRVAQTRLDGMNKALASLLQERDFVRRLPTWPWDGGTARAVASAIALPILLFLITRVLDRFV